MFWRMAKNRKTARALSWLAALAAGLAAASALAQDRAVTLNYEITLAGTFGFRIETKTLIGQDRFATDVDVRKQGVLAAFTSGYHAEVTSRGRLGGRLQEVSTSGRLRAGDEDRRFAYVYGPDGQVSYSSQPALKIKSGREVSDQQKRGSFDPLTAAIAALLTRDDPCQGNVPVFDGKHRFDLLIDRKGMEPVPDGASLGVTGSGLRCNVSLRRVAGYKPDDDDDDVKRPARLWLAKLDDSGRYYPVRLEFDVGIGSVVARLSKFDARPLTADEKNALDK